MDPEIARAQDARVRYLSPADVGDVDGRRVRVPSPVPLAESYAVQEHVEQRLGGRAVVRGSLNEVVQTPDPDDAFGITKWLVTAWNPVGEVCTLDENLAHHERLRSRLADEPVVLGQVLCTTPPDRSWAEDTLVVAGLDAEQVIDIARDFGQPAVTSWTDSFLTVHPTGLVDGIERVTRRAIVEMRPRTCPMRVDDVEGERCAMHGGPYMSRAIHSAGIWVAHRDLLLPRLGCDACADGTRPTLGPMGSVAGPILLSPVGLASRYGGYVWD